MGNAIGIARILKSQNEVKNKLLRLKTLHRVQGPSVISYQRIGRPESVENFHRISKNIISLLDTVKKQLDSISSMNSQLVRSGHDSLTNRGAARLREIMQSIDSTNLAYTSMFASLVELGEKSDRVSPGKKRLLESLNASESAIAVQLDLAESVINEQTEQRIREIGDDVTEVKKAIMLILLGITAFAVLFALIFSRTITNSLRRLKESASLIGKADFDINRIGYPNDEIGDLATAFFDMAVDLRTKQNEVIRTKQLAAIGELVASVNHEINNPLMIISGNAQFLDMSMEGYPEEMRERVRTILEETDRISRVTRKMREIKNPVTEDYTSSGEQIINLDKSSQ
jgi:nitrogen fixation/metabolism regulation signal transduction histidine kinase